MQEFKKFFVKSSFFVCLLVIVFLVLESGLSSMDNSYLLKRRCLENNAKDVRLLIFGTSEAYYDINPQVIDDSSCNLANSNQDLYFDSQILFKYLSILPNLKTVVLPVSYFSLEFDTKNSDEPWRAFFYERYFGISPRKALGFDIRKYSLIALYTPDNSRDYIASGFKAGLTKDISKAGWFMANGSSSTEAADPVGNAKRHTSYMADSNRSDNLWILNKMIDSLKARNIRIILVTLPVSKEYFENVDPAKYKKMLSEIDKIAISKRVLYLNYIQDRRFTDVDFVDKSDHLNSNSAERFSSILMDDISRQ